MGLNYDLGDKSENLRRMNHFEKFNKTNIIFFLQKVLDFLSIMCVFWCKILEIIKYDMGRSEYPTIGYCVF